MMEAGNTGADDPPKHTHVRSVVANALSTSALSKMSEAFRADAEALLQKVPVDCRGELRQRMFQIDDLFEPRPKQILLPAISPLLWPHRNLLPRHTDEARESQSGPRINLQENRTRHRPNLRKPLLCDH